MKKNTLLLLLCLSFAATLSWREKYRNPPKEPDEVLTAPVTPRVSISPSHDSLMIEQGVRYPSIAEVSEPMLRLAGLRINPRTNGPHRESRLPGEPYRIV